MTVQLQDHVALVTGAGRGIGRAVAVALAERGASVGLLARSEDELEQTADLCRRAGGSPHVLPADVTDVAAVGRVLARMKRESGAPDIVVVNHGIYDHGNTLDRNADAAWDRVLDVNLRASMQLTRRLLPEMIERDAKHRRALVFVSSIAARHHYAGAAAYCASKAGLSAFADVVFEEVRNEGIKVVQILPGYVNTPMMAGDERIDPERMVQPEDVANAVCWAISSPKTCCPVEIVLRPQCTPYRR